MGLNACLGRKVKRIVLYVFGKGKRNVIEKIDHIAIVVKNLNDALDMYRISPEYAVKAYGNIAKFGNLIKQEWQNDGSWIGVITIPAGMQDDLYKLLNHLTKGSAETKLIK